MKDRKDIEKRYEQFRCMELPGQPMMAHMGTNYLMNDLHAALTDAEAKRDRLQKAIEDYLGALESTGSARLDGLRAAL
jgi:hypothetical protein